MLCHLQTPRYPPSVNAPPTLGTLCFSCLMRNAPCSALHLADALEHDEVHRNHQRICVEGSDATFSHCSRLISKNLSDQNTSLLASHRPRRSKFRRVTRCPGYLGRHNRQHPCTPAGRDGRLRRICECFCNSSFGLQWQRPLLQRYILFVCDHDCASSATRSAKFN